MGFARPGDEDVFWLPTLLVTVTRILRVPGGIAVLPRLKVTSHAVTGVGVRPKTAFLELELLVVLSTLTVQVAGEENVVVSKTTVLLADCQAVAQESEDASITTRSGLNVNSYVPCQTSAHPYSSLAIEALAEAGDDGY